MDPIILSFARQKSLYQRLEVVANNVANVNTSGFKSELSAYQKPNQIINGDLNPSPSMLVAVDTSQGALTTTTRQLDVAIDGDGFFAADSPLGTRYTRSGDFTINEEGTLVTKDGWPVQSTGGNITFEPDDKEFEISENGEVYARANNNLELRGQIGVFKFNDLSGLQKAGNSYFTSTTTAVAATEGEDYRVVQGMLEQSNANSIYSITELIDLNRSVQQVSKIISDQHELIRNSVTRITSTD